MKTIIVTIAIAVSVFTNTIFGIDTIELNSISLKDINEMSLTIPEVKPQIISPELQTKFAAQSLRKELKNLGITAKVRFFKMDFDPTFPPKFVLAVEFANWQDFEKAEHLFQKFENGSLYYQGIEVSPRVPKENFLLDEPKDAFAGLDACTIVDAVFVRQPTIEEAISYLQPCMEAVSKKYSEQIVTYVQESHQELRKEKSIVVEVGTENGPFAFRDLKYAVKIRKLHLLGWSASVINRPVIINQ